MRQKKNGSVKKAAIINICQNNRDHSDKSIRRHNSSLLLSCLSNLSWCIVGEMIHSLSMWDSLVCSVISAGDVTARICSTIAQVSQAHFKRIKQCGNSPNNVNALNVLGSNQMTTPNKEGVKNSLTNTPRRNSRNRSPVSLCMYMCMHGCFLSLNIGILFSDWLMGCAASLNRLPFKKKKR